MNWISVKDRLPTIEESMREYFIVTVEIIDSCGNISREIYCDVGYGRSGWYDYDLEYEIVPIERNSTKVIAWAFSPEPYQGE